MEIAEILEGMGVSSALDFSLDNYRLSFNTTLVVSDLAEYSKLLADVLRRPSFDPEELVKTKIEWKAKYAEAMNSTRMLAFNKLRGNLYPKEHPFYESNFDDQLAELDQVSLPAIKELHEGLVKPNSMIVAIVGDIDFDKTIEIFERAFGDWTGGSTKQIVIPEVGLPAKPDRLTINLPDKRSADVVLGHPCSLKRSSADFYSARIANAALGQDTITSRLGQIVRDRAGLTYGIYSAFSDTAFGQAPWTVGLSVNPHNVDKALSLVSEVLKDFLDTGITEEELAKETGRAIGSFKVGLASSLGIARALSEFEFLGMGVAELDKITDRYASITKKQVDDAMRKYMHPDKALTVVSGTFR
jgi:zinc protease